jgi:malate dehydrogenase (oxaloacetate-decarboxylating)(NADP+)
MNNPVTARTAAAIAARAALPSGHILLDNMVLNKDTAFSAEEQQRYGIDGLLPAAVEGLDRQHERVMRHLDAKPSDLERYIYLSSLEETDRAACPRALSAEHRCR